MKPLNKKIKAPKKALRIESKSGAITEDFIALGFENAQIGTVSAIRSNISEVDVDAYYIKKIDAGKEKCVYFRKIGSEARVLFAEKKSEGHIPFTPYVLSEFSLNEVLHGRDRRVNAQEIMLADRKIGENELDYISMFMPADHQTKRKKAFSVALTNDEKYEFMAFYWKKGKSVPCASSSYIPVLFDALESVTFNNAELTSPEQAADKILLDTTDDEEVSEEAALQTEQQRDEIEEETASEKQTEPEEIAAEIQEHHLPEKEVEQTEQAQQTDSGTFSEEGAETEKEKAEKTSFFAKRRLKKQLKKEQKEAERAQKNAQKKTVNKQEKEQSDKIPLSESEKDEEDEISEEESEALAAAMPEDMFSEQELEDIFENPFEEENEQPSKIIAEDIGNDVSQVSEAEQEKAAQSAESDRQSELPEPESEEKEVGREVTAETHPLPEQSAELQITEKKQTPTQNLKKKKEPLFKKKVIKKKVSEPEAVPKKERYTEPTDYFPKSVRKEFGLGEFNKDEKEKSEDTPKAQPEQEQNPQKAETAKEEKPDVEEFFENEKPLTLLQILEAAEISNDNKKAYLQYMKPALMNTVYVVPISGSGENVNAVYVSKKAAKLLDGKDFEFGKDKELIMPDDEREDLRKGIKLKTIISSSQAYIPAFTSAEMFEQIFGKTERCGLFAFANLCSQTRKNAEINGVIINPEITDLKFEREELENY